MMAVARLSARLLLGATLYIGLAILVPWASSQTPPTITVTTQPRSQDARLDQLRPIVFSMSVRGGNGDLTFTWRFNGTTIVQTSSPYNNDGNVITDTFTVDPRAVTGGYSSFLGTYTCQVEDSGFPAATVTSTPAALNPVYVPYFTSAPQDRSGNLTSSVTFVCVADAKPAPVYKWKKNGDLLLAETQTQLTVQLTNASQDGTNYTCEASNSLSFISATARLTVISRFPYFITTLPYNASVNYGLQHTMRCLAAGTPGVTYQWYSEAIPGSRVLLPGSTSTSLTVTVTSTVTYGCQASSQLGTIYTDSRVHVIIEKPIIIYPSYSARTYVGYPLSIDCQADGIPKPSVFWNFQQSGYQFVRRYGSVAGGKFYKVSAEKSDQGIYTCGAVNVGGETLGNPGVYVIVDSLPPDPSFTFTSQAAVVTVSGQTPAATTPAPMTSSLSGPLTTSPQTTSSSSSSSILGTSQSVSRSSSEPGSQTAPPPVPITSEDVQEETTPPSAGTTASPEVTGTHSTSSSGLTDGQGGDDTVITTVVPVVVVIVVLLICILIVLYFVMQKKSKLAGRYDEKPLTKENRAADAEKTEDTGPEIEMDIMASIHPELNGASSLQRMSATGSHGHSGMTLAELTDVLTRVETAITSGERTNELVAEYEAVPLNMVSIEHSPLTQGTEHKNRYMNVLPNMETAVRLEEDPPGDTVSSYINANYLQDHFGKSNAFIGTQGPTADTISDFWRLVWQDKVSVIVMATQLVERGRAKCMRYWPDAEGSQVYGKLCVTVDDVTDHTDYILTTMTIYVDEDDDTSASKETRVVRHFWFKAWPDFGIPLYTDQVLSFIDTVMDANVDDAPVIIHCSAGIGRTGTLIAIKMGMQQFEAEGRINPLQYLESLRNCRGGCIQTFDQYLFVHRALLTYMSRNSSSTANTRESSAPDDTEQIEASNEAVEGDHSETKLL
eukprot:scpid23947/ scgid15590/ Receptor-type tyrosine-protein phosphatase R; Ch-1PTPase; NC-PTPCOM1; Protein-tyrosine phosphatase PCPTP1